VSEMIFQALKAAKTTTNMKRYFFFIVPPDMGILYHMSR
jgi:hypothetical protein